MREQLQDIAGSDTNIYFPGASRKIDEILTIKNSEESEKKNESNYQVNNQYVSVTTKVIDFSNMEEDLEDHQAEFDNESSEEETNMELNKENEEKIKSFRKNQTKMPIYKWSDREDAWKEVHLESKTVTEKMIIKIATFNIWSSLKLQYERVAGLTRLLKENEAHFICLQEVDKLSLQQLSASAYIRENYIFSDVHGNLFNKLANFGTIVLIHMKAEHLARSIFHYKFNTSFSGRSAVFIECNGKQHESPLLIVNIQLESLSNEPSRLAQLTEILEYVEASSSSNVILSGDFSAMSNELVKHSTLLSKFDFNDVWEDLHPGVTGNTFDQSIVGHLLSGKQRKKKNKLASRFDRILLKSDDYQWRPLAIKLLGNQPIDPSSSSAEKLYISTHFGLLVKLANVRPFVAPVYVENEDEGEEESEPPKKRQKK